ncbi:MAG: hypothetical protein MHM6MM_003485 [Cercozoa sp. M6MM]
MLGEERNLIEASPLLIKSDDGDEISEPNNDGVVLTDDIRADRNRRHLLRFLALVSAVTSLVLILLSKDRYGTPLAQRLGLWTFLFFTRFFGDRFRDPHVLHPAYESDVNARLFVVTMDYHPKGSLGNEEETKKLSAFTAGARVSYARVHGHVTGDCARPSTVKTALADALDVNVTDVSFDFSFDPSLGYTIRVFEHKSSFCSLCRHMNKVVCLLSVMKPLIGSDVRWLQWLDTDLLLANPVFDLRQYLPSEEAQLNARVDKNVVLAADRNGLNSGVAFYKVSDSTVRFLERWLAKGTEGRFLNMGRDQPPLISLWNEALGEQDRESCRVEQGEHCLKFDNDCSCVPSHRQGQSVSRRSPLRLVEFDASGVLLQSDEQRLPGVQVVPQFWFNAFVGLVPGREDAHSRYVLGDPIAHLAGYQSAVKRQMLLDYYERHKRWLLPPY